MVVDDWAELNCPLPKCGQGLWLRYESAFGLSGYYYNRAEAPYLTDIEVSQWKIECLEGHVILVPGELDIDDEDAGPVESDERRIFTPKDMQRLIDTLNLDWDKISDKEVA